MGYTHYWTYNPNVIQDKEEIRKKFLNAVNLIKRAHKLIKLQPYMAGGYYGDYPCVIRGGLGKGVPKFNKEQICFNGDAKNDLDHETFRIFQNEGKVVIRDFCKTARKPYDLLVCFSLLAMKYSFNDPKVFNFSSDGDNKDWETAKELFYGISGIYIGQIFPEEAELEVA